MNKEVKAADHVRIWKYKKIFAKGCVSNCSEEICMIKKLKILYFGHMLLVILMVKKQFMKKKTNQKEFRIEKVFKRKGDKLYVKWKGYDNSFNYWINKKDVAI